MYSEFDIKKEIQRIEGSELPPMRKARQLITLSRNIRSFRHRLKGGRMILREDDDQESVERLQQTLNCLKRMNDETRLAAFRVLKEPAVPAYGSVGSWEYVPQVSVQ